jgi:hypothetical protein
MSMLSFKNLKKKSENEYGNLDGYVYFFVINELQPTIVCIVIQILT